MRHRGLTIGGIKRGFDMPPSIFRFTRFISLHRAQGDHLARSSSTRKLASICALTVLPNQRGRVMQMYPLPVAPYEKSHGLDIFYRQWR